MRATIKDQALEPERSRFRPLSVRPHGGLLQYLAEIHKFLSRTLILPDFRSD
jgi:hypothetical protein